MRKRILCLLTVLLMLSGSVLNGIGLYIVKAEAVFSGCGSKDDPYVITNANDLQFLDGIDTSNMYFKLADDIELDSKLWNPISSFDGHFDGNGKTIAGLMINTNGTAGLFMTVSGTVSNLNMKMVAVAGRDDVGIIAGICQGTIIDCTVSGVVSGYNRVGGIAGTVDRGTIARCKNEAGVLCNESDGGGIVGRANDSNVYECANLGTITSYKYHIGGIVGSANGSTVKNCYNTKKVSGEDEIGGIVGELNENENRKSVIEACYNLGSIKGMRSVGAVVGDCGGYSDYKNCYYLSECAIDDNGAYQNAQGCDTEGESTTDSVNGLALSAADFKIINNLKGFDASIWKNGSNSPELKCFSLTYVDDDKESNTSKAPEESSQESYPEESEESQPESKPLEDSSSDQDSSLTVSTEEIQDNDDGNGFLVTVLILVVIQAIIAAVLIIILKKRKR